VEEDGREQPFDAQGVYVTLVSAAGGDPTTGYADDGNDGRYSAAVAVPEGGIGGIQIALMGWANAEPSPVAFPIANNPLPELTGPVLVPQPAAEEPPAKAPPTEAPASGTDLRWLWLLLAGLLALGALAVLVRRRHQARAA
jgi:LPXTG-motif cell wall-anchored protein